MVDGDAGVHARSAPVSGFQRAWTPSNGETNEIRNLFPFLQALARPDPTARAAQVLPPRQGQPDIQVAFGEIKDAAVVTDAAKMAELAFQLVGASLLGGRIKGRSSCGYTGVRPIGIVAADELRSGTPARS